MAESGAPSNLSLRLNKFTTAVGRYQGVEATDSYSSRGTKREALPTAFPRGVIFVSHSFVGAVKHHARQYTARVPSGLSCGWAVFSAKRAEHCVLVEVLSSPPSWHPIPLAL